MTRAEALKWLHVVKWMLEDSGHRGAAWLVEDVEARISYGLKTKELLRGYSEFIIEPGKRGHVTLVLNPPYEARVRAWLVGLLRDIDD